MPFNPNVDGCGGQFFPTADDYFMYFPEMRHRVDASQVTWIIGGPESGIIPNPIDPRWQLGLRAADVVDRQFRAWCDRMVEGMTLETMMTAYCEMLHTAVCRVWLGEVYKRSMVVNQ